MNKLKTKPLHPFLIAAIPVLALYWVNFSQVPLTDTVRSFAISVLGTICLMFFLRLLKISPCRAAVAISITLIYFFTFHPVYIFLQQSVLENRIIIHFDVFTAIWLATWILITWFIIRILKAVTPITIFLNITSLALFVSMCFSIIWAALSGNALRSSNLEMLVEPVVVIEDAPDARKPDIYYIILDGYPREDTLMEYFAYDNSKTMDLLREKGFFIASQSTANYSQTAGSIASSLNFDYLTRLTEVEGSDSRDYHQLRSLIQSNRARRFFDELGYQFIAFETGYGLTEIFNADRYIYYGLPLNEFEVMLISNSIAGIYLDQTFGARYRNRILQTFHELENLPSLNQPKFVFAHIMAAHKPFVFGPNGEVVGANSYHLEADTGDKVGASSNEELRLGQITYINNLLIQTITSIIEKSEEKPVIIIQADHGSDRYMDWQSAERTCFSERMAILNAIYLPDQDTSLLYESITPVNTFRVIMNMYFGTNLPLLEDRNYFYIWSRPYDHLDVTGVDGTCPDD